jgi:hypothetical protein
MAEARMRARAAHAESSAMSRAQLEWVQVAEFLAAGSIPAALASEEKCVKRRSCQKTNRHGHEKEGRSRATLHNRQTPMK